MDNKKTIAKEVSDLQQIDERQTSIEQKLDELLILLAESQLDSDSVKTFQDRFNNAVEYTVTNREQIKEFKKIDGISDTSSREELLDQFSVLLVNSRFDSKVSSRFIRQERMSAIVLFLVGTTMVTLGFAMIVMPAPPYFEMFTIYYFNRDDGVTLMDLISLCIIFAGAYLMIRAFYKKVIKSKKWQPIRF
ncbi:hypothetical protein [Mucilaginibacter ginkgonis]|uniref:Uncharacterized protein n=1 Tax=Mucilaginibacter ginkgonis TaxID=2682091 RepID=A0A6I4IP08_9SPHI|nr:hypothetical protein [Mucilaginibacter ginkgonis]QQL50890.1 hypothetical protein GO620_005380 [Mucilaginibacter ginkgonis]